MPDKNSIWGSFISIGLHAVALALLFITLPEPVPVQNEEPEIVQVELVQPPEPEPESEPAQPEQDNVDDADDAEMAQVPQAFESASDSLDEKTEIEPDKPDETVAETTEPAEDVVQDKQAEAPASEPLLSVEKPDISTTTLEKQPAAMKAAEQIYSDGALSDPRVKGALGQLSAKERVSQICTIEALEQVRRERPDTPPDMMARAGSELTESSLKMRGGAFRSRSQWYALDFQCEINADELKVKSFEYVIGDLISEDVRKQRGLPMD